MPASFLIRTDGVQADPSDGLSLYAKGRRRTGIRPTGVDANEKARIAAGLVRLRRRDYWCAAVSLRRRRDCRDRRRSSSTTSGRGRSSAKCQNLIHGIHEVQLHHGAQVLRNLGQVLLVVSRKDDFQDAGAVRRQQLLFQAADGQHLAAQRDFAGHGDVAPHRNVAERAGDRRGHGDAGGRDRPSGSRPRARERGYRGCDRSRAAGRGDARANAHTTWPPAPTPASRRPVCRSASACPLPSTMATSVVRMEPPTSVQARPVTRPTSLLSCTSLSRNFITPR